MFYLQNMMQLLLLFNICKPYAQIVTTNCVDGPPVQGFMRHQDTDLLRLKVKSYFHMTLISIVIPYVCMTFTFHPIEGVLLFHIFHIIWPLPKRSLALLYLHLHIIMYIFSPLYTIKYIYSSAQCFHFIGVFFFFCLILLSRNASIHIIKDYESPDI